MYTDPLLRLDPTTDIEQIAQKRLESFGRQGDSAPTITDTEEGLATKYSIAKQELNELKQVFWDMTHEELDGQIKKSSIVQLPFYDSASTRMQTVSESRAQIRAWVGASEVEHDSRTAIRDSLVNGRIDITKKPRSNLRRFPAIAGLQMIKIYIASLTLYNRQVVWSSCLPLIRTIGVSIVILELFLVMNVLMSVEPVLNNRGRTVLLRDLLISSFISTSMFSMLLIVLFLFRMILRFCVQFQRKRFPDVIERRLPLVFSVLNINLASSRGFLLLMLISIAAYLFAWYNHFFKYWQTRHFKALLITVIYSVLIICFFNLRARPKQ